MAQTSRAAWVRRVSLAFFLALCLAVFPAPPVFVAAQQPQNIGIAPAPRTGGLERVVLRIEPAP